jgi:hypothetical protein
MYEPETFAEIQIRVQKKESYQFSVLYESA